MLRDSDIELQEEAEDPRALLRDSAEAPPPRPRHPAGFDARMLERLQKFSIEEPEVGEDAVFVAGGPTGPLPTPCS